MWSQLTADRFKLLAQLLAQFSERLALRTASAPKIAACEGFVLSGQLMRRGAVLLEEVQEAVLVAA